MTEDSGIGITTYFTSQRAVKGTFKADASDFSVEEIPIDIERNENGKYLILKIRLRNWETNRFVTKLSRIAGISRKRVSYAGTKDKLAVSTQYFCVNIEGQIPEIMQEDVEILEKFRTDKLLSLGDLKGNKFTVNLRDKIDQETLKLLNAELESKGGFPNFYGYQRFGSRRAITHIVGKMLVQRKYEDAVMEYLCDPTIDTEAYRLDLYKSGDFRSALRDFPLNLSYERAIIQRVVETGDFENAFTILPKGLQMMFVHAYQSYMFNMMLSRRIKQDDGQILVHAGDKFCEIDSFCNQRGDIREINRANVDIVRSAQQRGQVMPTYPLIGYSTDLSEYRSDLSVNSVIEEEAVDASMFKIPDHRDLSSSGAYRTLLAKPIDLGCSERSLSFSLGKGIYATSYLREILKENLERR